MIEKGLKPPVILTGNLKITRDFSDVRDIVLAYYLLLKKGKIREIYNVGSGNGYKIFDLLKFITSCIKIPIKIEQQQNKVRKIDNSLLIANVTKLTQDTGWTKSYDIQKTIKDMIEYFRNTL